ncbi:Gfo/Idh/MocA family oxidoreductase [Burkholderia sp. Tr-20390]|uniref:Gfo/Idh/MocA family oxidoreductase n=1 Tax=Burkholderia sp. Tr-20390 TaxID=2703904 RepID=UPI001980BF7A|nr:Gfo/Idh/MocA family oxidoreductase [Burkholderia sp. Tr-20390]MBN3735729.1 Gfo/Idh/MocA family oxidoreductase [Burkholderia sp. Tr-20390]
MKVHPLPVVVAGSRFGQFYAAGLAASSAYRVAGILGQGSARTAALAARVGAPVFDAPESLPEDVRVACIAVGGAARGADGAGLACRLLERGIDVVIEHPLLPDEWSRVLRTASRHGRRCLLNSFYPNLPVVSRFIAVARRLRETSAPVHADVVCSVQASFAALDVLAAALQGVGPWSVEPVGPALSSMRECAMVLAETPVSLRVHNEMAAADDGRMSLLFSITLTTDAGTWTLASPHGPLWWAPALREPEIDEHGLFPIFGETAGSDMPSIQICDDARDTWGAIHARSWPQAAVRAVDRLVSGEGLHACNQRSIDVTRVWQQLTMQLGFPEQPPGDARAATLGMLLERAA